VLDARSALGLVTVSVLGGQLLAAGGAPPVTVLLGAPLAASVLWFVSRRSVVGWTALALAGAALGAVRLQAVTRPALLAGHVARLDLPRRATLVGRVADPPMHRAGRTALVLDVEAVDGAATSGRVRLAVRGDGPWSLGDRLRVATTLRRPRNFANPGSFDLVGMLARQGIFVTASVWDPATMERQPAAARGVRARLERWRRRLARAIVRAVPSPEAGVLQALVVGEEGDISPSLRDAFSRAGVVHVLSVSGLHVALVAAAGLGALRWLLGRSERLLLRLDAERVAAVLSLVPVVLYTALAGLGVATLRSTFMVVASVLAGLLGRRADVLRTLALAALVLALVWPGAPLDVSFQLSFVSVLAIVLGTRALLGDRWRARRWADRVRAALVVSACAFVGTAPLTAWHFHQVSPMGVIANPVIVPLFGTVVVGLGLAGAAVEPVAPWLAVWAFRGAGLALRPGIALVRAAAAPWWAAFDVPIPSLLELVLLYAAVGAACCLRWRAGRLALAAALAALAADAACWAHVRFGSHGLRVRSSTSGRATPPWRSYRTGGCSWSTPAACRAVGSTPARRSSGRFCGPARSSGSTRS
jgi:competence protein ComEC